MQICDILFPHTIEGNVTGYAPNGPDDGGAYVTPTTRAMLLDCYGPGKKELIRCWVYNINDDEVAMFQCDNVWIACANFPPQSRQSSTPQVTKSVVRYPRPMPRNIIHSDVSVDPESESEALSIAPDAEEEPEVEPEEEEEEGEGEIEVDVEEEDDDGDEREEGDDGDEGEEEGEDADEPEEEEEDDEPADDGDGDAVQEVRTATVQSPAVADNLFLLVTTVRP